MRWRAVAAALVTILLVGGLFVFGEVTGGFFAWFLFYFSIVLVIYEWLTLFVSLSGIQVKRELSAQRLAAGQSLTVRVSLRRRNIWPMFWVRIHEGLPQRWILQTTGLDRIHVPLWKSRIDYTYTVKNLPRGVYQLNGTTVETGDLLGLLRVQKAIRQGNHLIVYPRIAPVRGWTGHHPDEYGEHQPSHRRSEESSNVIGVRAYVPGDRLNRIHWPVTARTGQLQAKEFEMHVTSEFKFVPDSTVFSYGEGNQSAEKFDLAMTITASLLRHAYDNNRKFGMALTTSPHVVYPTGTDVALLNGCMESLAALQPVSRQDMVPILRQLGAESTRGTVFVIVSPRVDKEVAVVVTALSHLGGVQYFVPFTGARLTDADLQGVKLLQSAGAQVHLIRKSDQLSFLYRGGVIGATNSPH
ncbi:DUF58 domain-containing protein [Alicyclobacillus fodiniaquatilis]|uniref:DUF58 domain-containing protein n=1 Tax=Alicyclobacillus fodiniaquatilis TaxID=1661150 RepID=A0ABW4JBH1_9BACL